MEANEGQRQNALKHLSCLNMTIGLMSRTHQPAIAMSSIVEQFVRKNLECRKGAPQASNQDDNSTQTHNVHDNLNGNPKAAKAFQETQTTALSEPQNLDSYEIRSEYSLGLPLIPSSWFEELTTDDNEILDLTGGNAVHRSATAEVPFGASYNHFGWDTSSLNWPQNSEIPEML